MASRPERDRRAVRRRKGKSKVHVVRPFRVIVFYEGDVMCAQILEYDMAVHGRNLNEINTRLQRIIATHILACQAEGRKPFVDTRKAPAKYWNWFEAAEQVLPTFTWNMPEVTPRVPSPEIRMAAAVNG